MITTVEKRKQDNVIESDQGGGRGWSYQSGPNRDAVMALEVLMRNWFIEAGLRG